MSAAIPSFGSKKVTLLKKERCIEESPMIVKDCSEAGVTRNDHHSLFLLQVEFPPDLCSRVTFVNFTVTRSSLQSQCLNEVLKAERPDVDEKRSDLLKLQGWF